MIDWPTDWAEVLHPVSIWGHLQGDLQGENIQSYNLFSPVMMITWWMKLGGNLPPGPNALLFSATSSVGSFMFRRRHSWTYQVHVLDYPVLGKVKLDSFQCEADLNWQPVSSQTNTLTTRPPGIPSYVRAVMFYVRRHIENNIWGYVCNGTWGTALCYATTTPW